MSNGDDEATDDTSDDEASPESIDERLDEAAEALEAAETEADLDDVEATLDDIEETLESSELPEPDEEDEESPAEAIESRIEDVRGDVEEARGPYLEDVTNALDDVVEAIEEGEWTETGETDVVAAGETFFDTAADTVDVDLPAGDDDPTETAAAIADARDTLAELSLDPDEDAETIEALLTAATDLGDAIDAAEEWSDLTIREQLDVQGFYDILDPETKKDFPPEWNAIKLYATNGEAEPILTALEKFESDFMEENILDALERFAPQESFEPLHERAQKRAKQPIRILGRIGDDRACETLVEFLGGGDVSLEKETLRALGAIGCTDATQAVADRLVADNPEIRSFAARSLGMIGDPRAIDPLETVLADDDADEVRASAAWALNQIGTERALQIASEHADDRSYLVQAEAERATGA